MEQKDLNQKRVSCFQVFQGKIPTCVGIFMINNVLIIGCSNCRHCSFIHQCENLSVHHPLIHPHPPMPPSNHTFINQSIHSSTHTSVHSSIHPAVSAFLYPSTLTSISPSTHPTFIHLTMYPYIHKFFHYPSTHPSTHTSIHLFFHPYLH